MTLTEKRLSEIQMMLDRMTNEERQQILNDNKLRELIEKKIANLPKQIEGAISSSWKKDYELLQIEFKSLLEDSKK